MSVLQDLFLSPRRAGSLPDLGVYYIAFKQGQVFLPGRGATLSGIIRKEGLKRKPFQLQLMGYERQRATSSLVTPFTEVSRLGGRSGLKRRTKSHAPVSSNRLVSLPPWSWFPELHGDDTWPGGEGGMRRALLSAGPAGPMAQGAVRLPGICTGQGSGPYGGSSKVAWLSAASEFSDQVFFGALRTRLRVYFL